MNQLSVISKIALQNAQNFVKLGGNFIIVYEPKINSPKCTQTHPYLKNLIIIVVIKILIFNSIFFCPTHYLNLGMLPKANQDTEWPDSLAL